MYTQVLHSCTRTNMSVHGSNMSVPFCQILSRCQVVRIPDVHLDSCHLRCRTYVRCRTCMTYEIVRATHDIILYIVRAMSYVRYTGHLEPCHTRYRVFTRYQVTHWHIIGSCFPISGFSFDPISGHVACDPISGTYIGYTLDIGSPCHWYRKPHTWYRDQYRVQYRVSRYRWHDIPISVSISGTNNIELDKLIWI